jgi:DNA-binding transcriptional regulator YiaG
MKNKYKTVLLGSLHETATGLHKIGVIDDHEMQEYNQDCLVSNLKSSNEDIRTPTQNPIPIYAKMK